MCLGTVALAIAYLLHVQTASAQVPNTATSQQGLDEVVVTARKRAENIEDVPISIAAISGADIEARSLYTMQDLAQFTPNVQYAQSQNPQGKGAGSFYIRGVGQGNTDPLFQPGVGVYQDGVYLQTMQGLDFDLLDIERVEVLYGPQGTLFGRNTIGGALNIVTKRPTDDFNGSAQFETGSLNRTDGKLVVNTPIIPGKLDARVAVSVEKADGYGKVLSYPSNDQIGTTGNTNRVSARGLFLLNISDTMNALLDVGGQRIREENTPVHLVDLHQQGLVSLFNSYITPAGLTPISSVFETNNPWVSYGDGANQYDVNAWNTSFTFNWDLGGAQFKSITAYRHLNEQTGLDYDGTPYTFLGIANNFVQRQVTQELQLNGQSYGDRLKWTVGAFYLDAGNRENFYSNYLINQIAFGGPNFTNVTPSSNYTESYAGYGQATYSLTDKLRLTVGGRYSEDKASYYYGAYSYPANLVLASNSASGNGNPANQAFYVPYTLGTGSWGAVSGTGGLDYHITDNLMTYFSVGRGFKGGIPPQPALQQPTVQPEYILTYEVGEKAEFLERRMTLNTALYYSDYTNQQLTISGPTGLSTFVNAGKSRIEGAEVEFDVKPMPGLLLSANLGVENAKFTALLPGSPVTLNTKFTNTPEVQFTLSGQYTLPLGQLGSLTPRIDYAHQSATEHELTNIPDGHQNPYGVLNGRFTYLTPDEAWALSFSGTNLTNERYLVGNVPNIEPGIGYNIQQFGPPREWRVSIRYAFE
jgi:iron complex outermembrane receptor protein